VKTINLVMIEKENSYKRYTGKSCTNHIFSDRPLTAHEVEAFRQYPKVFVNSHDPVLA